MEGPDLKVFIITEGGSRIGFGHLTRMLAIYQAFEERGIRPRMIVNGDESASEFLKETDYKIYNWMERRRDLLGDLRGADIALIDSYLADRELYEEISERIKLPAYYDDNKRIDYPCGVVINGNIHAKDLNYPEKECVRYLLGTEFFPIRREFWRAPEKFIEDNLESLMITFGGSDTKNMTPKILKAVSERFPDLVKNVIVGKGFRNIDEIKKASDERTNLIYSPSAEGIIKVMVKSDIAVSAGGQTTYELARVGVPTIIVAVADNQLNNCFGWERFGFALYAGWWEDEAVVDKVLDYIERLSDRGLREKMSLMGRSLIDGQGTKRIVNFLLELYQCRG